MPYAGDFTGLGSDGIDDDDSELLMAKRLRRREQAFGANVILQLLHRDAADRQRQRDDAEARQHVVAKLRRRRR